MTRLERTVVRLQGRAEAITDATSYAALVLGIWALIHVICAALPRLLPALFA